jgi:hypothetical protein
VLELDAQVAALTSAPRTTEAAASDVRERILIFSWERCGERERRGI